MGLFVFPTGAANDGTIVMHGVWSGVVNYSEDTCVASTDTSYNSVSRNRFTWTVQRSATPSAKAGQVSLDAQSVLLGIKLKANVPDLASYGYCQADGRLVIAGEVMNHFVHCEDWGRSTGNYGVGRRVTNRSLFVPIINEKVVIDLTRGVYGHGDIEFVAYLEGYV